MYDKEKSFSEREKYQDIGFQYFETDSNIDCDFNLKFKKESFNNKLNVYEFCMDVAKYGKQYLGSGDFKVSQLGDWIDINLNLNYMKESTSTMPKGLHNLNSFLKKINTLVKNSKRNSLDNLIHEFIKENPDLLFAEEIDNDIEMNNHNQYSFIAEDVSETEVDPYIGAVLTWATIRSDQSNLIEYIIDDDLDKISDVHYDNLTDEVKEAVSTWVSLNENFSKKKRIFFKKKICDLVQRNLDDLIKSQEELERDHYLNKK